MTSVFRCFDALDIFERMNTFSKKSAEDTVIDIHFAADNTDFLLLMFIIINVNHISISIRNDETYIFKVAKAPIDVLRLFRFRFCQLFNPSCPKLKWK